MTFDDVIERVNEISEDQVDDRLDTAMWLIDELRKIYAPIIEMTQSQKNAFDEAKRSLNTHDLANNFGSEWTIMDEVSGNIFGHGPGEATDENIETVMQAWLHPELIKVVD